MATKIQSRTIGACVVYRGVEESILTDETLISAFRALAKGAGSDSDDAKRVDPNGESANRNTANGAVANGDSANGDGALVSTGRGRVTEIPLSNGKFALLRLYRRGGFVRHVLKQSFLRGCGEPRPSEEISILSQLYASGVSVPAPVAAVVEYRGLGLYYQAAIATLRVDDAKNLMDSIKGGDDREDIARSSFATGVAAAKMLREGVYHPDLHPGNVLQMNDGTPVLIDFDRAQRFDPNTELPYFRGRIIQRWERASSKYAGEIAQSVSAGFVDGMMSDLEERAE